MKTQQSTDAARRDERYMRMALNFAMRGTGFVAPNPLVGCVVVDDAADRVVSWGYHERYGGPHAEAEALKRAKGRADGKTVYVNLEPCCHTGKTPPCCEALISAKVAKVVVGCHDPNPLVGGGGVDALRNAGIEVVTGVLEDESRWINRGFMRRIKCGRPWVTVKAAISLDGNMAIETGESRWITGAESRKRAHMIRAESDAVLVGVGTVISDNPALNVRDADGRSPMKAVIDKNLDAAPDARIFEDGRNVVFAAAGCDAERINVLRERGVSVVQLRTNEDGRFSPSEILRELGSLGVNYLMIEGGPSVIDSFIKESCVDEYSLFIAPKLLGRGFNITNSVSFESMSGTIAMKNAKIRRICDDIWFEGVPDCSPDL